MTNATVSTIWDEVNKDHEFLKLPEPVREAMRPFVEALPTVLSDFWEKPATLDDVLAAKMAYTKYLLDNGFIKATADATPQEFLGGYSVAELFEMGEGFIREAYEAMEEMMKDLSAYLESLGVTRDLVMLGPNVGLNPEARRLYEANELTVGKLVELQPMVMVKSS